MKSQNHVLSYALIASLGGLLFGFDTAVISGTTHWLSEVFDLSSFWLGFTVASALIGTIIGSLHVGKPADRFGRKRMLIVIAALYFISALGSALAWNWTVSVISRGRTTESETVLQRCGVLSAKVGDEIAAIQDSFRSDDQSPKTVFFSKAHSRHIFLAIAVTFYTRGVDFSATGSVIILFGLIVFIASHAFGQGAVIWVYLSEIFPNTVRARGQALGSFTHWIMAAVISWTFPMIAEISGGHTFAFYALCMVGQLFWVIFVMFETKGISLEEIQKRMEG